tara:strand:+ start:256 stop:474 length:219 start_codon:yes stop_codon:yes gene_type:complete
MYDKNFLLPRKLGWGLGTKFIQPLFGFSPPPLSSYFAITKTPIFTTIVIKGILSKYIHILVKSPHMIQIIVF